MSCDDSIVVSYGTYIGLDHLESGLKSFKDHYDKLTEYLEGLHHEYCIYYSMDSPSSCCDRSHFVVPINHISNSASGHGDLYGALTSTTFNAEDLILNSEQKQELRDIANEFDGTAFVDHMCIYKMRGS